MHIGRFFLPPFALPMMMHAHFQRPHMIIGCAPQKCHLWLILLSHTHLKAAILIYMENCLLSAISFSMRSEYNSVATVTTANISNIATGTNQLHFHCALK